mmetsp:Transcript_64913/g.127648  ORF Transcript_64913/g.127648 Transcript_64913/m.127648 type:complete len:255 (-) Transcript_64913:158-922(-)
MGGGRLLRQAQENHARVHKDAPWYEPRDLFGRRPRHREYLRGAPPCPARLHLPPHDLPVDDADVDRIQVGERLGYEHVLDRDADGGELGVSPHEQGRLLDRARRPLDQGHHLGFCGIGQNRDLCADPAHRLLLPDVAKQRFRDRPQGHRHADRARHRRADHREPGAARGLQAVAGHRHEALEAERDDAEGVLVRRRRGDCVHSAGRARHLLLHCGEVQRLHGAAGRVPHVLGPEQQLPLERCRQNGVRDVELRL